MFDNKLLSTKEKNDILNSIGNYYDVDTTNLKEYYFYINENTRKVYLSNFNLNESGLQLPKINSMGMYFASIHDNKRIRLSIEGSKLIKPKKNYIILNKDNLKSYVAGEDLFIDEIKNVNFDKKAPFLIVRYEEQNIGCMNLKDKILMSYVPKSRRLDFNKIF